LTPSEAGFATINTGDGNDTITGMSINHAKFYGSGIENVIGIIDTGDGNDIITGIGDELWHFNRITTINTGNGDDIITAIGGDTGIDSRVNTTINTGDGNDIITATGDSGWGILLLERYHRYWGGQ
jgi:Ca2+-binding RTX toxin-like protein